jgi:hypothetical protein
MQYLPLISVILEDVGVIFLRTREDHYLNDSLYTTQFSSKWQLAPFYKTGAIWWYVNAYLI